MTSARVMRWLTTTGTVVHAMGYLCFHIRGRTPPDAADWAAVNALADRLRKLRK
jgi:hypothetical protein